MTLERRDTPAWWTVTAPLPADGTLGSTDATHIGQLSLNQAYAVVNDTVTVFADTAVQAATKALTGTITVTLSGQSVDYTFDPATVGTVVADHKPFLAVANGTAVDIEFEDMASFPGSSSDWDYNDRTWSGVEVATTSGSGSGFVAPAGAVLLQTQTVTMNWWYPGQTATVTADVYDVNHIDYVWNYHLVNDNLDYAQSYVGIGMFNVYFENGYSYEDGSDTRGLTTTSGWLGSIDTFLGMSGATWQGTEGDQLPLGGEADYTFVTDPRPIIQSTIEANSFDFASTCGAYIITPGNLPKVSIAVANPLIPVNANNDNWKQDPTKPVDTDRWLSANQKYIPKVRDFNATNLWQDDSQLVAVTVTVTGGYAGTLEVKKSLIGNGFGKLAFWEDRKKATPFTTKAIAAGMNPTTVTLYVEGQHESLQLNDSLFSATFTLGADANVKASDSKAVTIAPVIKSFLATTPNANSINFKNQVPLNGLDGLVAAYPPNPTANFGPGWTSSMKFEAEVIYGSGMSPEYLQNVIFVVNGANGSAAALVAVRPAQNWNFMIDPALVAADPTLDFPLLDANIPGTNPFYPSKKTIMINSTRISTSDSPNVTARTEAINERLSIIDVKDEFRMHLVILFDDQSIYSIASIDWNANSFATDNVVGSGVSKIANASKVGIDSPWQRSNANPAKTIGPVANGTVKSF